VREFRAAMESPRIGPSSGHEHGLLQEIAALRPARHRVGFLAAVFRRPVGAAGSPGVRTDVPFIYLSGTIGEETAIESLRSVAR